jgi:rRNA maturation endonuclease Nob1
MREYRIMCEECDQETHLIAEDYAEIEFCPCCGRRVEPEDMTENDDT